MVSTNDEIRVGDRFRFKAELLVATVTQVEEMHGRPFARWKLDDGREGKEMASYLLDETVWTRLPRETRIEVVFTPGESITLSSGPLAGRMVVSVTGGGNGLTLADQPTAKPKPKCKLCGEADHGFPASMAGSCPNYGSKCGPVFCLKGSDCGCPARRAGDAIIAAARRPKPKCRPKCRPDCTPANACMTAEVCPAYREQRVADDLAKAAERARFNWIKPGEIDAREAREWRSQRYEPSISGIGGGFVGSWNKRAVR